MGSTCCYDGIELCQSQMPNCVCLLKYINIFTILWLLIGIKQYYTFYWMSYKGIYWYLCDFYYRLMIFESGCVVSFVSKMLFYWVFFSKIGVKVKVIDICRLVNNVWGLSGRICCCHLTAASVFIWY